MSVGVTLQLRGGVMYVCCGHSMHVQVEKGGISGQKRCISLSSWMMVVTSPSVEVSEGLSQTISEV